MRLFYHYLFIDFLFLVCMINLEDYFNFDDENYYDNWKYLPLGRWKKSNNQTVLTYFCKYEERRQLIIGTNSSQEGETLAFNIRVTPLGDERIRFHVDNMWAFKNGKFDALSREGYDGAARKEDFINFMKEHPNIFHEMPDPLVRVALAEAYDLAFKR